MDKTLLKNDIKTNDNNYLILTLYSSKYGRYKSSINYLVDIFDSQNHLKDLRNNLLKNKKDEMILQTIEDKS